MSCQPGNPCYPSPYIQPCGCNEEVCKPASDVCYDGPNLPNTGINNNDSVTLSIQKIDAALAGDAIVNLWITTVLNNPALLAQICAITNSCFLNAYSQSFILSAHSLREISTGAFRIVSSNGFAVDWGDGSILEEYPSGVQYPYHTYSLPYTGEITIRSQDLTGITSITFQSLSDLTPIGIIPAAQPLEFHSREIIKLDGLVTLSTNSFVNVRGDILGWSEALEIISIDNNTLSGDISYLPPFVTFVKFAGLNTISGNINTIPNPNNAVNGNDIITELYVKGNNTLSGNVSTLPTTLIATELEGANTITGDIVDIPNTVTYFICLGQNTLSGELAGINPTTYHFAVTGLNTIDGDIMDLPSPLVYFELAGRNTVTGDIYNLPPKISTVTIKGRNTISQYTSGRVWVTTGLNLNRIEFIPYSGGLDTTEINDLLEDLYAAPTPWRGDKVVNLTGNAAPTGAGITAKNNLISNGVSVTTN